MRQAIIQITSRILLCKCNIISNIRNYALLCPSITTGAKLGGFVYMLDSQFVVKCTPARNLYAIANLSIVLYQPHQYRLDRRPVQKEIVALRSYSVPGLTSKSIGKYRSSLIILLYNSVVGT